MAQKLQWTLMSCMKIISRHFAYCMTKRDRCQLLLAAQTKGRRGKWANGQLVNWPTWPTLAKSPCTRQAMQLMHAH